jgi:uncharacterized protein (DUF58 family)
VNGERSEEWLPQWQASARQQRMFTLAGLALLLALATQRSVLVVLAVPPVWLLVRPHLRGAFAAPGSTATLTVRSVASQQRCLEDDEVEVRVVVTSSIALDQVDLVFTPGESVVLASGSAHLRFVPSSASADGSVRAAGSSVEASWSLRAVRWGRRDVGRLEVRAVAGGRLLSSSKTFSLAEVSVYPHHPRLTLLRAPAWLPDRVGDHVSRSVGDGVEFFDVREYQAGDRLRRINWRATARRGSLQANRTAAERACDVVLVLDAFSDVGGAGNSSLDAAVRGVVAAAQAYIDRHDRVGLVVLGGELRWLRADIGGRQFYRVVEQVLDARLARAGDRPALAAVPPAALRPGGLGLVFSPLLDQRALDAVTVLRARGVTPVVIDVRTCEPVPEPHIANSDLALRLWRIEHDLDLRGLESSGVPIVAWDGTEGLDVAFSQLPNRMRSA